ncbi:hypothetical protein Ahy_A07g032500 [Arachis hypogaea]|uniref:Uncharacterized protein n=1 Tax=Arachis hypogaea TaxID=3818 RepID=A0A445C6Y3_ARAHY|nr:hypothetical protein Ahy_A07g032500 [Arachis hypogaea]
MGYSGSRPICRVAFSDLFYKQVGPCELCLKENIMGKSDGLICKWENFEFWKKQIGPSVLYEKILSSSSSCSSAFFYSWFFLLCYEILLQTFEGVKFICENLVDVVIPYTISFEELKGVICEKIDSAMSRRISCILYRYPILVFGGFVQFQTKYITDEASMQEMFSMYIESRAQISFIELYIEFEQSETDRNIVWKDYNNDSEEEFESNYEVVDPNGDEDQSDSTMAPNVADVVNALANEVPFKEPSFMRVLVLEAMHAPEFPEYMSAEVPLVADGKFAVGIEFNLREVVIRGGKRGSPPRPAPPN